MSDVELDGQRLVTTSATTSPAALTSETWTVTALPAGIPTLTGAGTYALSDVSLGASAAQQGEIVRVTAATAGATSITVTRGVDGSTPVAHAATATFAVVFVASAYNGLPSTYGRRWQATTAYLAGDLVLNPTGQIVSRKVSGTSGATYDPANWTIVTGGVTAVGPITDMVRAAQYGKDYSLAVLSDSTSDATNEWPTIALRLLAAAYPDQKSQIYAWSDGGQNYSGPIVINAGSAPSGGVAVSDTFSAAGEAVGAVADTTGTWTGTGSVTKAAGIATPGANASLAELLPQQESTQTWHVKVTSSTGTGQYRFWHACNNTALTGYGVFASINVVTPTSTVVQIRKTTTDASLVTLLSETIDLGLNSATNAPATVVTNLTGSTLTVTITAGATVTVRSADLAAGDLAKGMGFYAGMAVVGTVSAITFDDGQITTAVINPGTITIHNGSVAGKNTDYVLGREAAMLPAPINAVALSYGHNSVLNPAGFIAGYVTTIAAILAVQPAAKIVISSQNPEFTPRSTAQIVQHRDRQEALLAWALASGYSYLPALEAFRAQSDEGLSWVQGVDGIHPTDPPDGTTTDGFGSTLWARTVTGIQPVVSSGITQAAGDARYSLIRCPLIAARWYVAGASMRASSLVIESDREKATYFVASRSTNLTGLAVNVTTAGSAGAVQRLGARADNAGRPGALIVDLGTVDATTTGVKTIAASIAVAAGVPIWIVSAAQGAPATKQFLTHNFDGFDPLIGFDNASDAVVLNTGGWMLNGVTGAFAANPSGWASVGSSTPRVAVTAAT